MGCNCGKGKHKTGEPIVMSETNSVLILYTHPNMGKKVIKGPSTFKKYGYHGGGAVFEVHKDDIRARPGYFGTCGNCREALTITSDDIFCPRCSQMESVVLNRPGAQQVAEAIQTIEPEPEPLPEPEPVKITEEELAMMTRVTSEFDGTMLEDIDFGRSLNKRHLAILKAEGIITLERAIEYGPENLKGIKGIGDGVVDAIMEKR